MHVARLSLQQFRSYPLVDLDLAPGVTSFVGANGQGKTNLIEAIDYLSRLASHRVAGDAPLVRSGSTQAVVRAEVVKDGRTATLEVEINVGKSNKARINKSTLPRTRDLVGLVRTVVFAPDDLALVKGDPGERRRFLDDLMVLRTPRLAGTVADYERVLRQRATLLKSLGRRSSGRGAGEGALATLEVWDDHLSRLGAELMRERAALVDELGPRVGEAYAAVARGADRDAARLAYRPSFDLGGDPADADSGAPTDTDLARAMLAELARRRSDELDRGVCLVGPHRDDVLLTLGTGGGEETRLPVKGYASHGEGWSFALALRLASFGLLRDDGEDPILVLDDVFAELDATRRRQLAELVADGEQVLVTAAVEDDVPEALAGRKYRVAGGVVERDD